MLVFIVSDITQAKRASATVCKAGPILGIRRTNRCKGRVHSTPRVIARITKRQHDADDGDEGRILGQSGRADQPESQGIDVRMVHLVDEPHDPDQESNGKNGQEQFDDRPGDGRQEVAPQRELVLVVIGQSFEHFAEVAGLLAHVDHFAEQGRKEITRGGQRLAEAVALVDHVADNGQVPAGRRSTGAGGLAAQTDR